MIPGTTPTLTLRVRDDSLDLGLAETVYFTLSQGATVITKDSRDMVIDGNVVQVWLSQKDTLRLRVGKADIQLNWTYNQNVGNTHKRNATRIKGIDITKQLLMRVVE